MNKLTAQIAVSLLAAGGLLAAWSFSQASMSGGPPPPPPNAAVEYPAVTTARIQVGNHQASVTGFGQAQPARSLQLTAEVSGRVTMLAPALRSGQRFEAGELLLKIDDTAYRQAVASARSELAAAEVELLQQQQNRKQARTEWQRSGLGGKPDSALALYEPQVKAARAKVDYARQMLAKAQVDLARTEVRAPFNALLVARSVELGSYLQAGTQLAQLYGTDQLEVSVELSASEWQNLPPLNPDQPWSVWLSDTETGQRWPAQVDRINRHIDGSSRQRALILRVDTPLDLATPIYPGTFVKAEIPGRELNAVWQLPASAITRSNQFWYLDGDNTLQSMDAQVHFRRDDTVYLQPHLVPGAALESIQVAVQPLSSYLPGMKVAPRPVVTAEMASSGETQ